MHLIEPYRTRPIHPLPPLEVLGWRLKVHGIACDRPAPRPELERAARSAALDTLPTPAERRAWVETVLANPDGPDLDAYLARVLEMDV